MERTLRIGEPHGRHDDGLRAERLPCLARGIGGLAAAEDADGRCDGDKEREREERAEEWREMPGGSSCDGVCDAPLERLDRELDTRRPGPEIFQGSRLKLISRFFSIEP